MKTISIVLSKSAISQLDLISRDAEKSKRQKALFLSINRKFDILKSNFQYGDPMAKAKIPGVYFAAYGITNLFRVELSNYWRMLYSVVNGATESELTVFVVEILDHKEYDKRFGYKKR